MEKKVLITTTAGQGHLLPLIPLANELKKQGNIVKVVAPISFAKHIKKYKLDFLAYDDTDKSDPMLKGLYDEFTSLNPEVFNSKVGEIVFGYANTKYAIPKLKQIVESFNPDLIISESTELAGAILAFKFNIPFARVATGLSVLDLNFLPYIFKGLKTNVVNEGIDQSLFEDWYLKSDYLTYFPAVFEKDQYSSPPHARVMRLRHQYLRDGKPERMVTERPLVYVTLGTIAVETGYYPRLVTEIINGLKDQNVDVVITLGEDADRNLLPSVPKNFTIEQWVDQEVILKEASLVICHAGSGTVLGSMAFGLPIIAIPLFADQLDNAEQIQLLNIGISLDCAKDVSLNVSQAVSKMLKDHFSSQNVQEDMLTHMSIDQVARNLVLPKKNVEGQDF